MSEAVSSGVATAAVGGCAALLGVAVGAGYALYRGLTWLSDQAQREMEQLEKEMSAGPTHATTAEAREQFKKMLALIKGKAEKNPHLKGHSDAVARILAIQNSALGSFLDADQRKSICQPTLAHKTFQDIFDRAARQFTLANALYVSRSIVEAAAEAGFTTQRFSGKKKGNHSLVLADDRGRAFVADIVESEEGARINFDLTGFGDGSCHGVMDRILTGLAKKGIRLDDVQRRSHYRREGVMNLSLQHSKQSVSDPKRKDSAAIGQEEASKRRRISHLNRAKNQH